MESSAATTDALVERIRAATGLTGEVLTGGVQIEGKQALWGKPATCTLLITKEGAFRKRIAGVVVLETVFDGEGGWRGDGMGSVVALQLEDLAVERLQAEILGGHWIADGSALCLGEVLQEEDGTLSVAARIDDDPLPIEIRIDPESWLPLEVSWFSIEGREAWTLRDWRTIMGRLIPYRVVHSVAGEETELRVQAVESLVQEVDLGPPRPQGESRFGKESAAIVESLWTETGHVLVRVTVDESREAWFLLDSGTEGLGITRCLAEGLGLETIGQAEAVRIEGTSAASLWRAASLQVGPLRLLAPVLVEADLAILSQATSLDIGGICGTALFSRAVVELEVGNGVSLHDPLRFSDTDLPWLGLRFQRGSPCAQATFDGAMGWFLLDTGFNGTVIFCGPTVVGHRLLDRGPVTTLHAEDGVIIHEGRIRSFQIGGTRWSDPLVAFFSGRTGLLADSYLDGAIGMSLLESLRLVIDLSGERAALVPRQTSTPSLVTSPP